MSKQTAMLVVGNQPQTIEAAAKALCAVLAAAGTEAAQIAAANALAVICPAPTHTSISNCSFVGGKK